MSKETYSGEFNVNNQLFFCGIPFRLDSYSGCVHQCRYCFARASELTNSSSVTRTVPLLVPDPNYFKHKLVVALDSTEPRADINIEWLRRRVPIHWGGMSDPFQPAETKYKITKQWMDFINWYNYPTAISTKGTKLLTSPEYLDLLKKGNYAVQVTLITFDDEIMKQLEPGAPLASERIDALKKLADLGIWTAVRIQPVIPNTRIEYDIAKHIEILAKAGVKHVLCEGYKVPTRSEEWMKEIWQMFPEALKEYQAYSADYFGFEKLLPSWRKYQYVKIARQACHDNGITFGAADNDLRDFSDTICCCGIDNLKGFENFWRYQASQAVVIAREKGSVSIQDMEQYWSGGEQGMDTGNLEPIANKSLSKDNSTLLSGIQDGDMRRNARTKNIKYTAKYCIDYMWDRGGEQSPEVITSLSRENDKNGQVVYTYKDPIPKLESHQVKQSKLF